MIGDHAFREAIRTVNVSYPIPFVTAAFLGFSVSLFIVDAARPQLFTKVCAGAALAVAVSTYCFALLRRSDLLRSERFVSEQRLLDIIGDTDTNPDVRDIAGTVLTSSMAPGLPKLPGAIADRADTTEEAEDV